MTVQIIKGNLLDAFDNGEVNVIGHVVNCQGVMGSGIAKSIKERYPVVFNEYLDTFKQTLKKGSKEDLLGYSQCVQLQPGAFLKKRPHPWEQYFVHNLFGQLEFGPYKRQLNYGAIAKSLHAMANPNPEMGCDVLIVDRIGFPYKMGCDRAGGDWNVVLEMIEFYFKNYDVKIYNLGD